MGGATEAMEAVILVEPIAVAIAANASDLVVVVKEVAVIAASALAVVQLYLAPGGVILLVDVGTGKLYSKCCHFPFLALFPKPCRIWLPSMLEGVLSGVYLISRSPCSVETRR